MTLPELLGKLERGRIGHAEAMRWLNIDSYRELVEVMHANGRQMPGHKPYELSSGNCGGPPEGHGQTDSRG